MKKLVLTLMLALAALVMPATAQAKSELMSTIATQLDQAVKSQGNDVIDGVHYDGNNLVFYMNISNFDEDSQTLFAGIDDLDMLKQQMLGMLGGEYREVFVMLGQLLEKEGANLQINFTDPQTGKIKSVEFTPAELRGE